MISKGPVWTSSSFVVDTDNHDAAWLRQWSYQHARSDQRAVHIAGRQPSPHPGRFYFARQTDTHGCALMRARIINARMRLESEHTEAPRGALGNYEDLS
jgi:hypothetical protein